ncbi:helix-turn-helix transcriptional regulator [Prevotella sp.]|uniref:helix-turn-helix transcriptional regulator n=1 Tax=Prevotella sp. TaxID=59823 RepID=UPI00258095F4|nr:helix-turn-helix transcriptional regulator [Prevotella sp.]
MSTKSQKNFDFSIDIKKNLIYYMLRKLKKRKEVIKILRISLAAARVNANMTQEEAAKALCISKNTLVSWEKGVTEPTVSKMRELSALYAMPMDNIFLSTKSN